MATEEKVHKELARIQQSIPKALLEAVIKTKKASPAMEMVVDEALKDPDFPEEKKKDLQILKDSGDFSRTISTEDKKIAKMIDEYVSREIKKSIKAGRLPKKFKVTR